jgi:hypothetical protein
MAVAYLWHVVHAGLWLRPLDVGSSLGTDIQAGRRWERCPANGIELRHGGRFVANRLPSFLKIKNIFFFLRLFSPLGTTPSR